MSLVSEDFFRRFEESGLPYYTVDSLHITQNPAVLNTSIGYTLISDEGEVKIGPPSLFLGVFRLVEGKVEYEVFKDN